MRLQLVTGTPFRVSCVRCKRRGMSDADTWLADLDGSAFKDYYCEGCAKDAGLLIECGCCGGSHRPDYYGDCRNDEERFP